MDKFIANSTANKPLGIPTGRKCLIIPAGQYAGRMAILYASASDTIKMVTADPPYTTFSTPLEVITNSADLPFDATFNNSFDIMAAFISGSGNELRFVKLSFDGGSWTPGSQKVVYDNSEASYPVIAKLTTGQLWIFYRRLYQSDYYINGKLSGDDGDTWTVSSDPGDTLTSGANSAYGQMVERNIHQYVFYTEGGTKIAFRSKPNSAVIWSSEVVLATEGGYDENFHAAVSSDGRIGLAYAASTGLKFREYNGSYWSSETVLDSDEVSNPAVAYHGGSAYVLYIRDVDDGLNQAYFVKQETDGFSDPAPIDPRRSDLDTVIIYNEGTGTYQDKTEEAASVAAADVFHSGSNALLSQSGDAVFFGCEQPFNFLHIILSTTGTGGQVIWRFWDGQNWQAFVPISGEWHFASGSHDLLFWKDYCSIPGEWQKKPINGKDCFWVAAMVASSFAVAPVGSRLNAVSSLEMISRGVS